MSEPRLRRASLAARGLGALLLMWLATEPRHAASAESLAQWPRYRPVTLPEKADGPWIDFPVTPEVFTHARFDLADLRLYDGKGREIPYALRVRTTEDRAEDVKATVFNRVTGPGQTEELSLDLGPAGIEHNEVRVALPGREFRRPAVLEGSDDAEQWREIARESLIRFDREGRTLADLELSYVPSRYRYLRLRVSPDPAVDKAAVAIESVTVRRRVTLVGEDLTLSGALGPREPDRERGSPASAWLIDLGGANIPCRRLEVDVRDSDFSRDYVLQAGEPAGSREPFWEVISGNWQRRAGEKMKPMVIEFDEIRAARLRLIVIDYRNPPLNLTAVRFAAPVRQVVFPRKAASDVRLYYGNPKAEAPHYDFAGTLPQVLEPPPSRAQLAEERENPKFVPEPLSLSERWPWLIYAVLGAVCLALAAVIVSVARRAIALHDDQPVSSGAV